MYPSKQKADRAKTDALTNAINEIKRLRVESNDIVTVHMKDVGDHFDANGYAKMLSARLREQGLDNTVLIVYNEPEFTVKTIPEDTILELAEGIKKRRADAGN